jgi:hypothetical protein
MLQSIIGEAERGTSISLAGREDGSPVCRKDVAQMVYADEGSLVKGSCNIIECQSVIAVVVFSIATVRKRR